MIENVPAEVCSVCGDVLLSLSTVEAIEAMLENPGEPVRTVPVYEMPGEAAARQVMNFQGSMRSDQRRNRKGHQL